jgi:putative ABC transport system permease protein
MLVFAAQTDSPAWSITPTMLVPLGVAAVIIAALLIGSRVPLRYNWRSVTVRWRTALLTAMAFTMVIALMTVMLAFVNGMYRLTQSSGQPGNVMILSQGSTDETFSNLGFSDATDFELQPGVLRDLETNQPLASRETYIVVNQPVKYPQPGRPKGRFLQVRGVEDGAMAGRVHGLKLIEGSRWPTQAGVQKVPGSDEAAIEAVLGEGVAMELGRDRDKRRQPATAAWLEPLRSAWRIVTRQSQESVRPLAAGELFSLGGRSFIVVGVMGSSGSTFDSEVWAKRDLVGPMFGKNGYTSVVLRAAGEQEAKQLANFFRYDYENSSVQAYVEKEYFSNLSATSTQFLWSIIFVTAVMGVGGVFGVMNTMYAAVAQRTKDVGVLRIIGYTKGDVQASFLRESLLLAMFGGILGCAAGSLAHGLKAASIIGSGGGGGGKFVVLEMLVSGDIIAAGLTLALLMGLIGGLFPSFSAMRLKPLESLR